MPALRADTGDGQLERAGEQTGLVGYKVVGETKITLMHKKKVTKESSIYTANAVVVGNNFNTNVSVDRKNVIKFAELINSLARRYFTGIALRYSNN